MDAIKPNANVTVVSDGAGTGYATEGNDSTSSTNPTYYTKADTLKFEAVFNESVTNVSAEDFAVNVNGLTQGNIRITDVSPTTGVTNS